jgi:hypothetical protein
VGCTDRDAQPGWSFGPDEWQLTLRDRTSGKEAIRQIRETLRNACPPVPRAERSGCPDWLEDELALPAAH